MEGIQPQHTEVHNINNIIIGIPTLKNKTYHTHNPDMDIFPKHDVSPPYKIQVFKFTTATETPLIRPTITETMTITYKVFSIIILKICKNPIVVLH